MTISQLKTIANNIRKTVVTMVYESRSGHLGCSLDIVDILVMLYFSILRVDPKNPELFDRDRFILSKGHACSALYAVLSKKGFFGQDLLKTYFSNGSTLAGHITYGSAPGIDATAGSLGHGLSLGVGMSIALQNTGSKARVFVLVGDGEIGEGSTWEAIAFAGQHSLNNIVLIIDFNNLQILGKTTDILNRFSFKNKLESFGWQVKRVNGHDLRDLRTSLSTRSQKPLAIIARTIKGKGVSFMENKIEWHGKCPTHEEYQSAIKELSLI